MPDCYNAQPDRPPPAGIRRWHQDLCQNVIMTMIVHPPEHREFMGEVGYWQPISAHPIRAVYVPQPRNDEEVCAHHYGIMSIDAEGYWQPAWCSEPAPSGEGSAEFRQTHYGEWVIAPHDDFGETIPKGYWAAVGAYHAPYWVEVHVSSSIPRCKGDPY